MLSAIAQLFYPPICAACEAELSQYSDILCLQCQDALPWTDAVHDSVEKVILQRLNNINPISHATSAFISSEKNITQNLIKLFKYHQRQDIGLYMVQRWLGKLDSFFEIINHKQICLIPIPIHPIKKYKRGYNQAELIAHPIAQKYKLELRTDIVKKKRLTVSQTLKNRWARMSQDIDEWEVEYHNTLEQAHFIIVDDILTTGATVHKCINALREKYPQASYSVMTLALSEV